MKTPGPVAKVTMETLRALGEGGTEEVHLLGRTGMTGPGDGGEGWGGGGEACSFQAGMSILSSRTMSRSRGGAGRGRRGREREL